MNSTSFGIETFATNSLTRMFCSIDESASHGRDPRTHPDWIQFLNDLKLHHSKVSGVLVLCYKRKEAPDAIGEPSFAFMLIPKNLEPLEESFSLSKAFQAHLGRRIVDYVEL